MDKQTFILRPNHPSRRLALVAVRDAPDDYTVVIREQTRSDGQNEVQWPILRAISNQHLWTVDGELTKLSEDDVKNILTASFRKETNRMAQGVEGGVVMLGAKTREFSRKEFGAWVEYLHWFCSTNNIKLLAKETA